MGFIAVFCCRHRSIYRCAFACLKELILIPNSSLLQLHSNDHMNHFEKFILEKKKEVINIIVTKSHK